MKHLLAGLAVAVVFGIGQAFAEGIEWLEHSALESRLAGDDRVTVAVGTLAPSGHSVCAAGSYAFELPIGYEAPARDLAAADLLPVAEGDGLLFVVDEERRLHSVSTLSVWPDDVMLAVGDPICVPVSSAQLDIRRDGKSLIVELISGN
jgi:hypothetical protein